MRFIGIAANCVVAPPCRNSTSCVSGTPSRRLKRSRASRYISLNWLPRWLISMTDMPQPCQLSSSACAFLRTASGSCAGPAAKL